MHTHVDVPMYISIHIHFIDNTYSSLFSCFDTHLHIYLHLYLCLTHVDNAVLLELHSFYFALMLLFFSLFIYIFILIFRILCTWPCLCCIDFYFPVLCAYLYTKYVHVHVHVYIHVHVHICLCFVSHICLSILKYTFLCLSLHRVISIFHILVSNHLQTYIHDHVLFTYSHLCVYTHVLTWIHIFLAHQCLCLCGVFRTCVSSGFCFCAISLYNFIVQFIAHCTIPDCSSRWHLGISQNFHRRKTTKTCSCNFR